MGDRTGMWELDNGDIIVWQPSIRTWVIMRDGEVIDRTRSQEIAESWAREGNK